MRIILVITLVLLFKILGAQNYNNIQVKEEFDIFNTFEVNIDYKPCTIDPNNDAGTFGDGMSKLIEGYIALYKATKDKKYLYKFVLQSLCMVENRHDINPDADNNEPRWSFDPQTYQDGYIIAAFSRFIYFIKIEEPSLFNTPIYQFDELNPANYAANTCNCNKFDITFSTLGQYVNWLQDRVCETLNWFVSNEYWDNSGGIKKTPTDESVAEINMQVGFGRAFLFIGLITNNQSYLSKAYTFANLYKGNVNINDPCSGAQYNEPVLKLTNDDAYWWYHSGWRVTRRECSYWSSSPPFYHWGKYDNYPAYVEYIEEISHGAIVTWLPLDFYKFQPNNPFTLTDMIRFRNMFTKHIYRGSNSFSKGVNGQDSPVCTSDNLDLRVLNYMPFYEFDGASTTATAPDVYDIVLNYYINNIHNYSNSPYYGQDNKGHAEVVLAQWTKECPNLTLYNREVVYNQDFFSKGVLTVAPEEATGNSYAEPIISDKKFIVKPNVTVNMSAPSKISLKQGTHIMAGAQFRAYLNPNLCNQSYSTLSNSEISDPTSNYNQKTIIKETEDDNLLIKSEIRIYPNPTKDYITIEITNFPDELQGLIVISDLQGRIIYKTTQIKQKTIIDLSKYTYGNYILQITVNDIKREWNIIKQ